MVQLLILLFSSLTETATLVKHPVRLVAFDSWFAKHSLQTIAVGCLEFGWKTINCSCLLMEL